MLTTEVHQRGSAQFDMTGRLLGYPLRRTEQSISAGLAQRLHRYAAQELIASGFGALAKDATVTVYTMDAEVSPADRSYSVRWHTPQGGYVELVGILTKRGWPSLDHGFEIGFEKHD